MLQLEKSKSIKRCALKTNLSYIKRIFAYIYFLQLAPLKFFYRILIYSAEEQSNKLENHNVSHDKVSENSSETYLGKVTESAEPNRAHANTSISINGDVKAKSNSQFLPPPLTTKVKSNKSSSSSKHHSTPVAIAPKPVEAKKSVSKKHSVTEDFVQPTTNDFKSLRSNDIRYSQYAVTSSTTSSSSTSSSAQPHLKTKVKPVVVKEEKPPKCDIVVSIPHNQMQEEWDSKPLSQLKTASKKSPNPSHSTAACTTIPNDVNTSGGHTKKVKNVPKLKIELNSLRTKLIEKPKSADIRLDSLIIKHHRPRKFSLDEKPVPDKVDLQTYVKNIGLKPIEVQTTSVPIEPEVSEKFTPNASPRSSCSSSTTSSSNGHLNVIGEISTSSSSSHKKRKKKHSKDSKEPRDSKRKKMHAEISSRGADESLKMKVKLTAPLNIKPSKLESKRSPSSEKSQDPLALEVSKSLPTTPVCSFEKPLVAAIKTKDIVKDRSLPKKEKSKSSIEKKFKESLKLKPLAIKTCGKDFEDDEDIGIADTTSALSLSKPLTSLKDDKLPHSPPLPPSLFKTTPITFTTFTPNNNSNNIAIKPKQTVQPKHSKDKFTPPTKMKPLAPKPMPVKPVQAPMRAPQFAVPNLPRLMATNSNKFLSSTPTSIASSANKQMGNLLKRSASLDDTKTKAAAALLAKQPKLDRPHQITVSAYGSNLQVTKVDVPATPTSSTAKATFEIPLYSPLSASYNPKCSFTVSSASSSSKASKANLSLSINTNSGSMSSQKAQVFSNSVAVNKMDKDAMKKTSVNTNIPAHASKTNTTLMGPPLPLAKLGTIVPTAVKSPPLGSVLPLNSSKMYSHGSCTSTANPKPILAQTKSSSQHLERKTEMSYTATGSTNGSAVADKPKSSLRQFRLPSRESGQDILDLSSVVQKTTTTNGLQGMENKSHSIPASPTSSTAGTSLELALTKIKQNMTNSISQEHIVGGLELKPNSDDLQNLHMLSESATAREKIAINSSSSGTGSLYEKCKVNQNTLVRQQNASVRNIPNPSALAFRNQQPSNNIPMVTIAAPLIASLSNDVDKPILSAKQPLSPKSPLSPNCSTSTSPPRSATSSFLSSKKHPSIDQVAASLNIRATAAAAAEATAKANLKQLDESTLVTSTSSLAETVGGNKLKQIKQETPEHTTNHEFVQTSASTVQSSSSSSAAASSSSSAIISEVVEIKQEPEEKFHDSILAAEDQREARVPTMPMATTTTMTTLATASKVENLVTSVINVSTPTSTLLTTSSGGF